MECREVYETGLLYHHYANTAYPLTPRSFMQYRLTDETEIRDFVTEEWKNCDALSLYIHIPFCQSRCRFCEYVVLEHSDEDIQETYVELLLKEMKMYSEILRGKKIIGYDLGGGTPTKLTVEQLRRITDAVRELFSIDENVIFSIETTPVIAANDPEKIKAVYDMGYRRISMGVQTVSEKLLAELGRDGSKSVYEKAVANIRQAGFERFNLDLMYGFLHQSESDFDNTLHYAVGLAPDYITLYRNRYKGTKIEFEAGGVSIYKAMYQYRIAHRVLTENGYQANVGKNTFSRIENDYGTSDYLTTRVINGTPYVGMGLGAQSFGMNYLAYNLGAAEKRMERYRKAIEAGKLPFQDIYRLPQDENIAKSVSVAFYFGFVDLDAFQKRFSVDFCEYFRDEIKFVTENELMEQRGRRLYLTDRGADYINGVIPLFYSERSKNELKSVFAKQNQAEENGEALFLSTYHIEDYERPSVAADIATFALRRENEQSYRHDPKPLLSVLLIQRGEHPYMNCWALPGGFLRPDETIEECAARELCEETNVSAALVPIGVFSKPDRDPRGRILSNAFLSVLTEENVKVMGGDDALHAKWFEINMEENGEAVMLSLQNGDTKLTASLIFNEQTKHYEITENNGLAFDHAAILAAAMDLLRKKSANPEFVFEFLPKKFTLTQLQTVQETITGQTVIPANFRRKIAGIVEETEEYVTGAGHRPAKLFIRKKGK